MSTSSESDLFHDGRIQSGDVYGYSPGIWEKIMSQPVPCPVCGSRPGEYSVAAGDYQIAKCPNCGLEYTLPIPDCEALKQFYNDYTDIRANPEIVAINARRNLETLREYGFCGSSDILDFGCGNGEFVETAGTRCVGVELASRKKGERIFDDIEATPVERYDYITLWGVLEHLNDPVLTVGKLSNRLRQGGRLVMTTVDAEGSIPYYYKPPEHLTYWTSKSLQYLLARSGLEIKTIQRYKMCQLSEIYLNRLLSRTPVEYQEMIASSQVKLPRIVTVPTNEIFIVAELTNC